MSKNLIVYPSQEMIERKIFLIRGKKVMLDRHLAELYKVPTKVLNQAVKRNLRRFPEDFMFQLSKQETQNWRSQIVTSNFKANMGLRYSPYAFTENGISMLSSVLNSESAISVNILIVRTFTALRELIATNELIRQKIDELEKKYENHDHQFKLVCDAIKEILNTQKVSKKKPIGFHTHMNKGSAK